MKEKYEHFNILNSINVNDRTEEKNGLTYLSWAWAWTEVKKEYPDAKYEIKKFENNLPYVYDENTGYMVFTEVTIEGITHEMWLPVMDSANKAMKNEPYEYVTKSWDKTTRQYVPTKKKVEAATMFDINKTIMRCLTKNLSMFGLGLYIYAGEDMPEVEEEPVAKEEPKKAETKKVITATPGQVKVLEKVYTGENLTKLLELNKIKKLEDMPIEKANEIIKKINEKAKKEGN